MTSSPEELASRVNDLRTRTLKAVSEVVVGLFSAALFANEVFGWREFIGALFIVSAAVIELMPKKT